MYRELAICFVDTSLRRINLSWGFEKRKKKIVETLRKGFGWDPKRPEVLPGVSSCQGKVQVQAPSK